LLLLREAVEGIERATLACLQDPSRARHPIGAFSVNQMAYDVERAPGPRALAAENPGLRQLPKKSVQRRRRTREESDRFLEVESHSSSYRGFSSNRWLRVDLRCNQSVGFPEELCAPGGTSLRGQPVRLSQRASLFLDLSGRFEPDSGQGPA